MKKKIVLIALLVLCLAAPVFASLNGVTRKDSLGVGLNLGTNTGVAFRYGMGDFDITANVSFDVLEVFNGTVVIAGDVGGAWNFYTIDGGRNLQFPLTFGVSAVPALVIGDGTTSFNFSILFPVGIEYTFDDVPITVYLKLAPGMSIVDNASVKVSPEFGAYIGALWNF